MVGAESDNKTKNWILFVSCKMIIYFLNVALIVSEMSPLKFNYTPLGSSYLWTFKYNDSSPSRNTLPHHWAP